MPASGNASFMNNHSLGREQALRSENYLFTQKPMVGAKLTPLKSRKLFSLR